MSGFKLLAIRPFLNCSDRFSKNLQKGTIYKFYRDYDFLDKDGEILDERNFIIKDKDKDKDKGYIDNDVRTIVKNSKVPEDLYRTLTADGHSLNINICALVGKNGSGKSTLIEILYALCYVIALKKGIINDNSDLSKLINKKNIDHNKLFKKIYEIQDIYLDLRAEIYYEIDGNFFSVWYNDEQILYHRSLSPDYKNESYDKHGIYITDDSIDRKYSFVLDQLFFYNISINYSLYGLNSIFNNSWLNDLFHKNDGYQTPLVINPFRKEGNIDVNSELHLAQSRLLSNLVDDTFKVKQVVNGKKVHSLLFTLDYSMFNTFGVLDLDKVVKQIKEKLQLDDSEFITTVYNALYTTSKTRIDKINLENVKHADYLVKYVYRKILKIYSGYEEYKMPLELTKERELIPNFRQIFSKIIELREDRSHVTLKLRQILNTIRFNVLSETEDNKWIEETEDYQKNPDKIKKHYFNIILNEFIERIKEIKAVNNNFETIELIPVACFRPSLDIRNGKKDNTINDFQGLSSGEQHFIHSLQSVLYHIANINSVFNSDKKKIRYNYLNLVFDEIELYYHPEFQKSFIKELLDGIGNLSIPNIKGINILFSTHSPFILSDITRNSVLKLQNGIIDNSKAKSFGANVHDILADDFFLKDGFMGDFAKNKIQKTIDWLNELREFNLNDNNSTRRKSLLVDKDNHLKIINLIDEPLLKFKLEEIYNEIFPEDFSKDNARKQIEDIAKRSGIDINFD